MTRDAVLAALLSLAVAGATAGCGIGAVEGTYVGTVHGSWTLIGIPFSIDGDLSFDLLSAGTDIYSATGDLKVRRKSDHHVVYDATLSGEYAGGRLNLTFAAKDGKSSGTMTASTLAGKCFNNGTWTLNYTGGKGSGGWSACR
jgi:hypothetical protein